MPSEHSLSISDQEHLRLSNALRESEILRELSALLASSLDIIHILQILVKRTTEVCDVERCAVWLLEETRGLFLPGTYHLSAHHLNHEAVQVGESVWYRSSLSFDDPVICRLLQEDGMVALEDLRAEPSMQSIAEKFLVNSVLLVALVREGRPVGIMSLDNPGKMCTFSPEQQQLARAISQQAAVAVDNARLYQQAQTERRRAEQLIGRVQSIYQVAMAVNSGEDLSVVLEIATQHLIRGLSADGGAIALLDADTLSLASTITLQPRISSTDPMLPTSLLANLPHCHKAAARGGPIFVTTDQVQGAEKHWYSHLGLDNVMIVPLIVGTKSKGGSVVRDDTSSESTPCVGFAFVNYHQSTHHPSKGQYAYARDIAAQCALAIEKARILSEAHQAAVLATERANTLDAVFHAMTEGITVLDLSGQVLISNSSASRFLGIPLHAKEQLTTFLSRYPTYTLQGQPIAYEDFPLTRALRGEQIRGERFVAKRADGSERTVEINVEPLFDSESRQIGVASAFRDVTEQIRVERRIRRALDTMLHAAEAVSGITDLKEILRRVLAMTLTTLSCERGAVLCYSPEHQTFVPLLSIGYSTEAEAQWLDEQQSWLIADAQHYAEVRTQLLEGHATLITAEQYPASHTSSYQTMVLAAPIIHNTHLLGVMLLDRSSAHRAVALDFSHQPKREFTLWDIAVVEGIAQFAGLALEDARWQQEAQTARTNEATMREASELKDEFLAITAHEFRTPLTVILAHSQMMQRSLRRATAQEVRDKLQESLAIIEEQTHQLTNIVNIFLEVTRLNRGQIALSLEEVDLVDVVKQAVATHAATTTIHDISYKIEPNECPYLVRGDKARLLQILTNLLQNAIKYSPFGGSITVSLRQRNTYQGASGIEVCVEDKGIGVPKEAQPHLFERFYRASNIEGSKTRGIGLGLYIVAEFLRLQGGTITIESSGVYGEGSRFIFTLPLLKKDERDEKDVVNVH